MRSAALASERADGLEAALSARGDRFEIAHPAWSPTSVEQPGIGQVGVVANGVKSVNSVDRRPPLRLPALLVMQCGALCALQVVGRIPEYSIAWSRPTDWMASADPLNAIVAIARAAGLALCLYMIVATLLYWWATRSGRPGVARFVGRFTLPVLRRAIEVTVAASLSASAMAAPAFVSVPVAMAQEVEADAPEATAEPTPSPEPDSSPTAGSDVATAAGWPDTSSLILDFWTPAQADLKPSHHVVVQGENFWTIAKAELESAIGREVTEDEVCSYWLRLVAANRARISSGDPNVIYPGESITLPAAISAEAGTAS